jgi:hypothetical protein
MRERVSELGPIRDVALTKARIVGRDDAIARRQARDQVSKHVRGSRETVQQHDDRGVRGAGLAIKHFDAFDLHRPVVNAGALGNSRRGVGARHGSGDRSKQSERGDASAYRGRSHGISP